MMSALLRWNPTQAEKLQVEIKALQAIRPHALITTSYDEFLEVSFPEYQRVISRLFPSFTGAESCPQIHSSTHHCKRLLSSLLIGNASEQFIAPSASCPEAFPIKANDFSDTWVSAT